ncbi:Reverse transcriptase (RNA-dependent DNA polymerase) [Popillia japonica]|uniref:Reverse transcriptase (RNA-dependent DNA polymerase) n=1 Tax=Popillia japonica TaxID=7064 RepID=A0AAW1LEV8_POPJA
MKTRLLSFLEKNKLLTDAQHGYRSERTTLTAAISLVENILNARDDQSAKLVLYDLSKAFDTVPHDILLHKLNFCGIRGTAWKLMPSYLHERQQTVLWNSVYSATHYVTQGIPQGSILGPIMFIIYLNDLPDNVGTNNIFLYADDTSLLVTDNENQIQRKEVAAIEAS